MTETSTTTITETTATNLRKMATLLENHPDLAHPYITSRSDGQISAAWFLNYETDSRAIAAQVVRSIPGGWTRGTAVHSGDLATWTQNRDGLELFVQVKREEVCERIVVGSEQVTIPAVEAQPERTETRDLVEWRCQPLLADEQVST